MQPNEKITGYYDLDSLTGQALREAEAIDTVTALDALFESGDGAGLPQDFNLLPEKASNLTSGAGRLNKASFQASEPYEVFEHNGIIFESKIYRISSGDVSSKDHLEHGFVRKTIYLIGLVPSESKKLGVENFKFGVVRNESGEQTFFSIIPDAEGGTPNVAELNPENETLVVEELKKAAAAATSQSELGS